ncbi:MAG: Gfo/Idh/MocA family oxidoreductase, partial [Actinobacteria bacterium]|nr:Gfo/Idh/MocA family oxidoreductase [Actinomycetota bacterium]
MESLPLRVGVIGLEHLHVLEMVNGLVEAGAETVCHTGADAYSDLYAGWRTDSEERTHADIVADDSLDLIVLAGIPSERADHAIAALEAGRHVLAAKPAVTTRAQLDRVDAAARASQRRWWVFFSERWCNRAISKAVELVHAGAIGELVAISGSAPHRLNAAERPEWFRDPDRGGSVLVDLAAHQADQLLALAGPGTVEVLAASMLATAASPWPGFFDVGRMSLRHRSVNDARTGTDVNGAGTDAGAGAHAGTDAGTGAGAATERVVLSDHHVDWLTPDGLPTWGDVRLSVTGTAGAIEVRSNLDIAGAPGAEHLFLVDGTDTRRVDCSGVAVDWASRLIADVRANDRVHGQANPDRAPDPDSSASTDSGNDTLCAHEHTVEACAITLRA